MNQIESRPLRYFVAVAEELNFARAAARLGIASPPLSRAISQLETQLGVRLLHRTTREVALTAAGSVLLDEARPALAALDAAARRAVTAGQQSHRLTLALKADHDGGLLDDAIAAYEDAQATPIDVVLCGWGEQWELLGEGRADLALGYDPPHDERFHSETLLTEPYLVAIAAPHPLAAHPALRRSDLDAGLRHWPNVNLWTPRIRARGVGLPQVGDLSQLIRLIELGRLVAVVPASVAERYPRRQIVYRPLKDAPPATLALLTPSRSSSLPAATFTKIVLELAAARRSALDDPSMAATS